MTLCRVLGYREEIEGSVTARSAVELTPEMVNTQFALIDPTTPTEDKTQT